LDPELDVEPDKDTSLIKSGLLDSLALFKLALWIEKKIGMPLNPAKFDLLEECDTMTGILNFIEKQRKK
jgi:acyl carrier protein